MSAGRACEPSVIQHSSRHWPAGDTELVLSNRGPACLSQHRTILTTDNTHEIQITSSRLRAHVPNPVLTDLHGVVWTPVTYVLHRYNGVDMSRKLGRETHNTIINAVVQSVIAAGSRLPLPRKTGQLSYEISSEHYMTLLAGLSTSSSFQRPSLPSENPLRPPLPASILSLLHRGRLRVIPDGQPPNISCHKNQGKQM